MQGKADAEGVLDDSGEDMSNSESWRGAVRTQSISDSTSSLGAEQFELLANYFANLQNESKIYNSSRTTSQQMTGANAENSDKSDKITNDGDGDGDVESKPIYRWNGKANNQGNGIANGKNGKIGSFFDDLAQDISADIVDKDSTPIPIPNPEKLSFGRSLAFWSPDQDNGSARMISSPAHFVFAPKPSGSGNKLRAQERKRSMAAID